MILGQVLLEFCYEELFTNVCGCQEELDGISGFKNRAEANPIRISRPGRRAASALPQPRQKGRRRSSQTMTSIISLKILLKVLYLYIYLSVFRSILLI